MASMASMVSLRARTVGVVAMGRFIPAHPLVTRITKTMAAHRFSLPPLIEFDATG